jgi:hypothetical protein
VTSSSSARPWARLIPSRHLHLAKAEARVPFLIATKQSPPPRLFAILAREAPTAVIFRRGPSNRVELVHWDRSTDEFTPGAWFYGRIRVKRCDLSPDGSLLVYFASKYGQPDVTYRDTWTAVSRPPWLTALALWPKGDSWNGGGLFSSNTALWVNHDTDSAEPHEHHRPPPTLDVSTEPRGQGEDYLIYSLRLARDGWVMRQQLEGHPRESIPGFPIPVGFVSTQPELWERPIPGTDRSLRMIEERTDYTLRTGYEIVGPSVTLTLTDAAWAEVDPGRGVVFASAGTLFRIPPDADDVTEARPLVDLTDHHPELRTPPEWAKLWPWEARSTASG